MAIYFICCHIREMLESGNSVLTSSVAHSTQIHLFSRLFFAEVMFISEGKDRRHTSGPLSVHGLFARCPLALPARRTLQ